MEATFEKFLVRPARAEVFEVQGLEIFYASKKSLIGLKNNTVREKDQLDVQALKKLEEDQGAFD